MVRLACPPHPGQFIKMEIVEPLGLSVTQRGRAPERSVHPRGHLSPSPLVLVVFALTTPHAQLRPERRTGAVQSCMHVQR